VRHELRKAAYSSLLRAERLSRDRGKFISSLIQYDFDFDGVKEYLFQDARINCYIQQQGAGIFELDYLPKDWNYLDCGCAPSGRRTAFADALVSAGTKAEALADIYPQNSRLCFNEQYDALTQDRKGKACFKLPAASSDLPFGAIEINKCYSLKREILTVSYTLKNTGKEKEECVFVTEINFSFAGEGEDNVRFHTVDKSGKDTPAEKLIGDCETLKILDVKNEVHLLLVCDKLFSGCLVPAYNGGLYQATRILPLFSLSLESGESWSTEFNLKFSY
jgi:hypothetical protein